MTPPVALVTGGARRVGASIVRALAVRGYHVAIHYSSSEAAAEGLLTEIGGADVGALFQANFEDPGAPDGLIEQVGAHFGRLDVLINSAASFARTPLDEVTPQVFDEIMAVNLRAPFFLSVKAAKLMRTSLSETEVGLIVNIADLAAFEAWSKWLPHSISKRGIVEMTRGMARAWGPFVRVNAIAPGVVLLPDDWPPDTGEELRSTTPLGRIGSPSDVVGAVHYLLDAMFVTGETLVVDGGRLIRNHTP